MRVTINNEYVNFPQTESIKMSIGETKPHCPFDFAIWYAFNRRFILSIAVKNGMYVTVALFATHYAIVCLIVVGVTKTHNNNTKVIRWFRATISIPPRCSHARLSFRVVPYLQSPVVTHCAYIKPQPCWKLSSFAVNLCEGRPCCNIKLIKYITRFYVILFITNDINSRKHMLLFFLFSLNTHYGSTSPDPPRCKRVYL